MKKLFSAALSLALLLTMAVPAFAREEVPPIAPAPGEEEDTSLNPEMPMVRQIIVNGEALDLLDLPVDFYKEGEITMVPLRRIGEALGLTVGWDPETGDITIEDSVQKAALHNGSTEVVFTGKLKIINLSREMECTAPVTILGDGYTYVPLSFFEEFFQDVEENDYSVTINTQMCYIQDEV